MVEAPTPGVKNRRTCNRVKIFLMFDDGVISSLSSSAADGPFHDPSPDPERATANTLRLRELCPGEWSLYAVRSLFWPQEAEVARRSLTDITCEGGGAHCSTIMQLGAGACGAWAIRVLPRSGVFICSGVLILSGVMALSGVLDHSNISRSKFALPWEIPPLGSMSSVMVMT